MPILSTKGAASASGFGGIGGGGGGGGALSSFDITWMSKSATAVSDDQKPYQGAPASTSFSNWTVTDDAGTGLGNASNYTNSGDGNGIWSFTIPAGEYYYMIQGGVGNKSVAAKRYWGTLTFGADTDVLLLCGLMGTHDWGAGGMTALAAGTNYTNPTPILVAGGSGCNYGAYNVNMNSGPATNSQSSANSRRSCGPSNYGGGAGFFNTYQPEVYVGDNGAHRPNHFVQGGRGSPGTQSCDQNNSGGWGGGGGGCPGGAGGFAGGFSGGDGPTNPGGGGTTYYNSSYATLVGEDSNFSQGAQPGRNFSFDTQRSDYSPTDGNQNFNGFLRLAGYQFY